MLECRENPAKAAYSLVSFPDRNLHSKSGCVLRRKVLGAGDPWCVKMGGQQSTDNQLVSDKQELIAAALSAAFDEKVVTKQEYERRKNEPGFGNAESLDLRFYEKICYEPVKGQYGDVFGENGNPITVILKSLSGQSFTLSAGDKSYVEELKFLFEEQVGIPLDHSRLIFTFKGKQLEDGFRVSDYGVSLLYC